MLHLSNILFLTWLDVQSCSSNCSQCWTNHLTYLTSILIDSFGCSSLYSHNDRRLLLNWGLQIRCWIDVGHVQHFIGDILLSSTLTLYSSYYFLLCIDMLYCFLLLFVMTIDLRLSSGRSWMTDYIYMLLLQMLNKSNILLHMCNILKTSSIVL
jgi:hypothetical protein